MLPCNTKILHKETLTNGQNRNCSIYTIIWKLLRAGAPQRLVFCWRYYSFIRFPFPWRQALIPTLPLLWDHLSQAEHQRNTHSLKTDPNLLLPHAPGLEWRYYTPLHMFSVCGMRHITHRLKTHTHTPHWVCRRRLDLVRLSLDPYTWELRPEGCQCNCHGQCHASGGRCRNTSRSKKSMTEKKKNVENENAI